MKKLHFIVLILLSISCEDILKENPKLIVAENFYNSPDEAQSAVFDIYNRIKAGSGFATVYPTVLESSNDFSQGRGSFSPLKEFQGLDATNISRITLVWNTFYEGIRGANLMIGSLNDGTELGEDQLNRYLAEAKFIRAFIYFHIVRNWGNAVLRTEENVYEQDVPLSTNSEICDLIEEDLLFSKQYLPSVPETPGSATTWAARTLLGDLYFYQKKYSEASNEFKEVIDSDEFELIEISSVDDFEKIFGADLIRSDEEIFYLKYSREQSWTYLRFTNFQSTPFFNNFGLGAHILESDETTVFNSWDDNDLRKQLWFNWEIGVGPNTYLTRKFIDRERVGSGGGNDYPFYRFADVLLLYAESSCRANNAITNESLEALNMVHRRAYGADPSASSGFDYQASDFVDVDDFVNTVMDEHGYEFNMEGGKRWLYLKQQDNVKAYIKARTGKDINDRHFLWPFPISETDYNDAIDPVEDQNPGY